MTKPESLELHVDDITVEALLATPTAPPRALMVLAHGAGAGMRHAFMEALSARLVAQEVAVLRYNYPYMQLGRRRPDGPKRLLATTRAALQRGRTLATELSPDATSLPLFAGGKSMGGRMTTLVAADGQDHDDVAGIVLYGFPLHAAGKPSAVRGEHLAQISVPTFFLTGTRDKLADLELLEPLLSPLDLATLTLVQGADHGFHVLKRDPRDDEEVLDELARSSRAWIDQVLSGA